MNAVVLFWILLAMSIGGSTPALTKLALEGLPPWSLVVARQSLGLVILYAMLRASAGAAPRLPFDRRDQALLLALAWAGFALPMLLNAQGLALSSATNGALLTPLEPIGILIGSALFLGERFTAPRVAAIALGTLGGTLIVLQGTVDARAGDLRGDALMAAGHLAWAIYTLAAKSLLRRHDPLRVAMIATALSIPPLLPPALAETVDPSRVLPALGWIALLALLSTALITYAWNTALRTVSAATMAAFIFLQPLVGLSIGALLLGETVGLQALAGAVLIVAGVTLAGLRGES